MRERHSKYEEHVVENRMKFMQAALEEETSTADVNPNVGKNKKEKQDVEVAGRRKKQQTKRGRSSFVQASRTGQQRTTKLHETNIGQRSA